MIRFSPNQNRAHLVHWFEWGEEAFQKAREQNKPVMLFLTAFWCRFCQRMDEGAFSDTENMALLNAYFIAVRADNAQRPDVDVRYNRNGWPMIAFMTPAGKPFGVSNFLPAEEFKDLVLRVYMTYQNMKDEISRLTGTARPESVQLRHRPLGGSALPEITQVIVELADRVHGGYGQGQKFIHPEANDFLLSRYEATKDAAYLEHVCLTLERMRQGAIHDHAAGGYFRTSSGADWSQPHREKLLAEQAGLLANCLRTYRITERRVYAEMAEDILGYLNGKLSDDANGVFYGCEDFLRRETADPSSGDEYFSILDDCIYTDANARTIAAYLEAASLLGESGYQERALKALEFLWNHCRSPEGGMFHYLRGTAQVPGLLNDQTRMGAALVQAHKATGDAKYLEGAKDLAAFILAKLTNPRGGYNDLCVPGPALLNYPVTLIDQNGAAASFFLDLVETTKVARYREAATWAMSPFTEDFAAYGIQLAEFGQALGEFANHP